MVQYGERVMVHIEACMALSGGHTSAVQCFDTVAKAFLDLINDPIYEIQMQVWYGMVWYGYPYIDYGHKIDA